MCTDAPLLNGNNVTEQHEDRVRVSCKAENCVNSPNHWPLACNALASGHYRKG